MRGRAIPLSVPRRIVVDYLRHVRRIPSAPIEMRMCLDEVMAVRAACADRPPWTAIFVKAYALAARDMPELRQAYITLPRPHIYEYPTSVAGLAVEREIAGEKAVLTCLIKDPASLDVAEIGRRIRYAASAEVESVKDFARILRIGRMPGPMRRIAWWLGMNIGRQRGNYIGTFGVSVFSGLRAEAPYPMSAWGMLLSYGIFDEEGNLPVRLTFDHRLMDGSTVARALARIEEALKGPVTDELRVLAAAPASELA